MESLDHMLTDPLELGPCGDGHGTRIMEDCLLGSTQVSLPEDLLEDVSGPPAPCFRPYLVNGDVRQEHLSALSCAHLILRTDCGFSP